MVMTPYLGFEDQVQWVVLCPDSLHSIASKAPEGCVLAQFN